MSPTEFESDRSDRSYIVMAIFPGHSPQSIGSYGSRAEAEAALRFLQRRVPQGRFYVIDQTGDRGV